MCNQFQVRPVINVTDAVTVKFKLKLSQLIDVVSVRIIIIWEVREVKYRAQKTVVCEPHCVCVSSLFISIVWFPNFKIKSVIIDYNLERMLHH